MTTIRPTTENDIPAITAIYRHHVLHGDIGGVAIVDNGGLPARPCIAEGSFDIPISHLGDALAQCVIFAGSKTYELFISLNIKAPVLLVETPCYTNELLEFVDFFHCGATVARITAADIVIYCFDMVINVLKDEARCLPGGIFHLLPLTIFNPQIDGAAADVEDVGNLLLRLVRVKIKVFRELLLI